MAYCHKCNSLKHFCLHHFLLFCICWYRLLLCGNELIWCYCLHQKNCMIKPCKSCWWFGEVGKGDVKRYEIHNDRCYSLFIRWGQKFHWKCNTRRFRGIIKNPSSRCKIRPADVNMSPQTCIYASNLKSEGYRKQTNCYNDQSPSEHLIFIRVDKSKMSVFWQIREDHYKKKRWNNCI